MWTCKTGFTPLLVKAMLHFLARKREVIFSWDQPWAKFLALAKTGIQLLYSAHKKLNLTQGFSCAELNPGWRRFISASYKKTFSSKVGRFLFLKLKLRTVSQFTVSLPYLNKEFVVCRIPKLNKLIISYVISYIVWFCHAFTWSFAYIS